MSDRAPTVLVFDSGLGGLTVFSHLRTAMAGARFIYLADDSIFPYGGLEEAFLTARVVGLMEHMIARYQPDVVVIACNTASTLVLPALRARFSLPFVGTVPAIKPAVAMTVTGRVSILATPGTVRRDYTRSLIESFAGDVRVDLVGSSVLASLAERDLGGYDVDEMLLSSEIAPCFIDSDNRRTDVVVLACTHYPLLLERMQRLAPWPVAWLDPAPAIARRAREVAPACTGSTPDGGSGLAVFTGGRGLTTGLRRVLAERGLAEVEIMAL